MCYTRKACSSFQLFLQKRRIVQANLGRFQRIQRIFANLPLNFAPAESGVQPPRWSTVRASRMAWWHDHAHTNTRNSHGRGAHMRHASRPTRSSAAAANILEPCERLRPQSCRAPRLRLFDGEGKLELRAAKATRQQPLPTIPKQSSLRTTPGALHLPCHYQSTRMNSVPIDSSPSRSTPTRPIPHHRTPLHPTPQLRQQQ